jgi:predicted nucleotidyltransferase
MKMKFSLAFPTSMHEQIAEMAYAFFQPQPVVDTVLVTNSCARGQATPESDLDMAILVHPDTAPEEVARLEELWKQEAASSRLLNQYLQTGKFAHVHLDLVKGQFVAEAWDDGGGPDYFEVGIGNAVAYSAPLHAAGPVFRELQARWLPYYDENLRQQRLAMVSAACRYDLDHIPFFVRRELYFQAFDRLYKAFQEFLQALFIARRVYPLAYNKWIRMQVAEWLGLPDLYRALPAVISVANIEGDGVAARAEILGKLLEELPI